MDDTKYFEQAVTEFCLQRSMRIKVADLSMGELSLLLRRAQELKESDLRSVQRFSAADPQEVLSRK